MRRGTMAQPQRCPYLGCDARPRLSRRCAVVAVCGGSSPEQAFGLLPMWIMSMVALTYSATCLLWSGRAAAFLWLGLFMVRAGLSLVFVHILDEEILTILTVAMMAKFQRDHNCGASPLVYAVHDKIFRENAAKFSVREQPAAGDYVHYALVRRD